MTAWIRSLLRERALRRQAQNEARDARMAAEFWRGVSRRYVCAFKELHRHHVPVLGVDLGTEVE